MTQYCKSPVLEQHPLYPLGCLTYITFYSRLSICDQTLKKLTTQPSPCCFSSCHGAKVTFTQFNPFHPLTCQLKNLSVTQLSPSAISHPLTCQCKYPPHSHSSVPLILWPTSVKTHHSSTTQLPYSLASHPLMDFYICRSNSHSSVTLMLLIP